MGLLEEIIKGMAQGQGGMGNELDPNQQQQQQQYPQQQGYPQQSGQPSGNISIEDLEREMGVGKKSGNSYQQTQQQQYPQQQQQGYPQQTQYPQQQQQGYPQQTQYPQQQQQGYPQQTQYPQQQQQGYPQQTQYPQQQQTGGSVIPGVDDYLPTEQGNTLPTGQQQQQLPGCSGGGSNGMPGCSGGIWKVLGLGALLAFLFRRKS